MSPDGDITKYKSRLLRTSCSRNRRHKLNIYGTKIVRIPVPKLITFYNGTDEREDRVPLRLSDAFPEGADIREADIEVTVAMLNISHGRNRELMEACEPLAEYSWFINEIRQNQASGMDIEAAVDKAIDAMPAACLREYGEQKA